MAGLVKLRCSAGHLGERPQWAELVDAAVAFAQGGQPTDASAALNPHNIEKAVSHLLIDGNVQFSGTTSTCLNPQWLNWQLPGHQTNLEVQIMLQAPQDLRADVNGHEQYWDG